MLVRTHMQDLKDVTREIHYENYRAHCIQNMTRMVVQEKRRRWAGSLSLSACVTQWYSPQGPLFIQHLSHTPAFEICDLASQIQDLEYLVAVGYVFFPPQFYW